MGEKEMATARERGNEARGEGVAAGTQRPDPPALATLREARRPGVQPSETRYGRLLRQAPAIICELGWDGTTLFANEAVGRITGYSPSELQGRNFWALLCPAVLHAQIDNLTRQLENGDVSDHELVIQAKDGTLHTLVWDFARQRIDGNMLRIIGCGLDLTAHKRADDGLRQTVQKLRGALEGTVEAIALTVELRDPYTAGHQRRVASLASAIGEELGLQEEPLRALRLAGTIHDIGKISVPEEILMKRGPMTEQELELIRGHPQVGYAILNTIDFPWPVARIVYQHHERLDGSGYPMRLKGEDILFEARILAVADVIESMAGPRPYRQALGIDEAIKEVTEHRGRLYDPRVVDACLKVVREIEFDWQC